MHINVFIVAANTKNTKSDKIAMKLGYKAFAVTITTINNDCSYDDCALIRSTRLGPLLSSFSPRAHESLTKASNDTLLGFVQ